jgi:hypothetical protein
MVKRGLVTFVIVNGGPNRRRHEGPKPAGKGHQAPVALTQKRRTNPVVLWKTRRRLNRLSAGPGPSASCRRAVRAFFARAPCLGEKGVRLAQKRQVGPWIPVETQLQKAEVGPTSGPTWRPSHFRGERLPRRHQRARPPLELRDLAVDAPQPALRGPPVDITARAARSGALAVGGTGCGGGGPARRRSSSSPASSTRRPPTWEKQVLSARGFKRVGRHSEYAI